MNNFGVSEKTLDRNNIVNLMNLNDYETAKVLTQVWLEANDNLWGKWNMAIILDTKMILVF